MMTEPVEPMAEPTQAPHPAGTGTTVAGSWQTPGYAVVETALEVTGYYLATR